MYGYTIGGVNNFKKFFILYGPSTNNGKTTESSLVAAVLGKSYASSILSDKLSQNRRRAGGHDEDIADLRGRRCVLVTEPEAGQILDPSLIKTMTGGGLMKASRKGEHLVEFKMQAVPIYDANFRPRVTDPTVFRSERAMVVPYPYSIPREKRDPSLKEKFLTPEGMEAIMRWLVEGYSMLMDQGGFELPDAVRDATAEYADDSDKIGSFFRDCLATVTDSDPRAIAPIYKRYQDWCKECGYQPESLGVWKTMMAAKGVTFSPAGKAVRPRDGHWETITNRWGDETIDPEGYWEESRTKGKPTSCLYGWRLKTRKDVQDEEEIAKAEEESAGLAQENAIDGSIDFDRRGYRFPDDFGKIDRTKLKQLN